VKKVQPAVSGTRPAAQTSRAAASTRPERRALPAPNGGRVLEPSVRQPFEHRLGHDFSTVRIHDDSEAASLAGQGGAKAMTTGSDIYFSRGRFAPRSSEGDALLGHELAHVAQQRRGGHSPDAEARADDAAGRALRGEVVTQSDLGGAAASIQAKPDDKAKEPLGAETRTNMPAPGRSRSQAADAPESEPRSLKSSLAARVLSDQILVDEIERIHAWQLAYPKQEGKLLAAELDRLEAEAAARQMREIKHQAHEAAVAKVVAAVEAGRIPKWMKVFPFLPSHGLGALLPWDWEFDQAPIMAHREGDSIVVRLPYNSVKATRRFNKDTKTLPIDVFLGEGFKVNARELVGVRLYDEGEKVVVIYAEDLLKFADASDKAVLKNIAVTALSVGGGMLGGEAVSGFWAARGGMTAGELAAAPLATRAVVSGLTGATIGGGASGLGTAAVDAPDLIQGKMSWADYGRDVGGDTLSGVKTGFVFGAAGEVAGPTLSRVLGKRDLPKVGSEPPAPLAPIKPPRASAGATAEGVGSGFKYERHSEAAKQPSVTYRKGTSARPPQKPVAPKPRVAPKAVRFADLPKQLAEQTGGTATVSRSPSGPEELTTASGEQVSEVRSGEGGEFSTRQVWEPPRGAPPRPPGNAPKAVRQQWLKQRLQMHVDEAVERYRVGGLTEGQEEALRNGSAMREAFRGSRIDQFAKDTIMQDPDLAEVITAPDFFNEPDILDSVVPDWFDITTRRDWVNHLIRYGDRYFYFRGELLPTR